MTSQTKRTKEQKKRTFGDKAFVATCRVLTALPRVGMCDSLSRSRINCFDVCCLAAGNQVPGSSRRFSPMLLIYQAHSVCTSGRLTWHYFSTASRTVSAYLQHNLIQAMRQD